MGMRPIVVAALLVGFAGCELPSPREVSRLNEIRFRNQSGAKLSRVVFERDDWSHTLTDEDGALNEYSSHVRKLTVSEPMDSKFKLTVHFVGGESATHEFTSRLDPAERKLIEVTLNREHKFTIKETQRNPHIQ